MLKTSGLYLLILMYAKMELNKVLTDSLFTKKTAQPIREHQLCPPQLRTFPQWLTVPTSPEGWLAEALSTLASKEPHETSKPRRTTTPLPPPPFPMATARCAVPGRVSSASLLPNLYAGEFMIGPHDNTVTCNCEILSSAIHMHTFLLLSPVLPSFRMKWFGLALFFITMIMNSNKGLLEQRCF